MRPAGHFSEGAAKTAISASRDVSVDTFADIGFGRLEHALIHGRLGASRDRLVARLILRHDKVVIEIIQRGAGLIGERVILNRDDLEELGIFRLSLQLNARVGIIVPAILLEVILLRPRDCLLYTSPSPRD